MLLSLHHNRRLSLANPAARSHVADGFPQSSIPPQLLIEIQSKIDQLLDMQDFTVELRSYVNSGVLNIPSSRRRFLFVSVMPSYSSRK